jgi:hypothetical protein
MLIRDVASQRLQSRIIRLGIAVGHRNVGDAAGRDLRDPDVDPVGIGQHHQMAASPAPGPGRADSAAYGTSTTLPMFSSRSQDPMCFWRVGERHRGMYDRRCRAVRSAVDEQGLAANVAEYYGIPLAAVHFYPLGRDEVASQLPCPSS